MEAEREHARIRAAQMDMERVKGDHRRSLREIEAERRRLKEFEEKVKEKEREQERVLLRAEIERDNLKTMHQLLDM